MGSRADRRIATRRKVNEMKARFFDAWSNVQDPVTKEKIANAGERMYLKLRRENPAQDAHLVRQAMNESAADLIALCNNPKESPDA